jgi:hypothetical protein
MRARFGEQLVGEGTFFRDGEVLRDVRQVRPVEGV